jgi:hypothetical protein
MNNFDVCNLALSFIGNTRPITSFADNTTESILCDRFYNIARESLLVEFPWGFAKKSCVGLTQAVTVDVVTSVETPEEHAKYGYVYLFPDDALRIVSVKYGAESQGMTNEFEIIYVLDGEPSKRIVCDVKDAKVEYIVNVEDVNMFSSTFIEALAWKLASMIAVGLAKDTRVAQYCGQMYMTSVEKAKHIEALQNNKPVNLGNRFMAARR